MLNRDPVYVEHMLVTARRVRDRIAGMTRGTFDADDDLQLAITHLLQTIGEAARLVSDDLKERTPGIPWHAITGMRHRIVHDYVNIDLDIVWKTASKRMQELIESLEPLLAELDAQEDNNADPPAAEQQDLI